MPNITIIGNSIDALAAIETLKSKDPQAELALFCPEGVLPYDRSKLPLLVAGKIKESAVFLMPDKFYSNINVHAGDVLARISTKRRHITGESKKQYPYEQLLLCDVAHVHSPALKGHQKEGVYNPYLLSTVKELIKYLPFADTAVVSANTFASFDMACALSSIGKEVILLTKSPGVLPSFFDEETAMMLKQLVESKNIRVMVDSIEEILGDAEVKAVKLKSSKVVAAQMVILDEVIPDLRSLSESGLLDNGKVQADEHFRTQVDGVFACGSVQHDYDLSPQELFAYGQSAALNMLSQEANLYSQPLVIRNFGPGVCEGFCGGYVRILDGGRERMQFDGPKNIYKKIYIHEDRLVGAVWFNAPEEKDRVALALNEQRSLVGQEEQFFHA